MRKSAVFLIQLLIAVCLVLPSFAEAASAACTPAIDQLCAGCEHASPEATLESNSAESSPDTGTAAGDCNCFLHHHCGSHASTVPTSAPLARFHAPVSERLAELPHEPSRSAFLAGPFQPPRA